MHYTNRHFTYLLIETNALRYTKPPPPSSHSVSPTVIVFTFNTSKSSQFTILDNQTDSFQPQQ